MKVGTNGWVRLRAIGDRFTARRALRAARNPVEKVSPARQHELRIARRIVWGVSALYVLLSFVIFREVLFAIPAVLRGDSVIVGDELVPFLTRTANSSSRLPASSTNSRTATSFAFATRF